MQSLRIPEHPRPGVNLVGFLEAESGLGEFARRLASAIDDAGIPYAAISYRGTLGRQRHPVALQLADEAPFDVNLVSLSADDLTRFAGEVGTQFFANRYSIGVWFWETTVFRAADRAATRFLDELWVASQFVREAVEAEADLPVHVVPLAVEAPPGPFRDRRTLALPEAFTFLYLFDFWSAERKNPEGVVRAFKRAFAPREGPVLVLKCVNGRKWEPDRLERLTAETDGRDDILIRDGYVSADERDSYIAACDCYVSLHRSEGLGLTMAEAMALAKPVIATAYAGNREFMSEENSYLVPFRMVDVPTSWWAYAPGAKWAEPDVDFAARLMREVWEDGDRSASLGRRARSDVLARFAPERAGRFVAARLADARARGAVHARTSAPDPRPAILELSRAQSQPLGLGLASQGRSRPTRWVRRILRRALWPELAAQGEVDANVLAAVEALHRSVGDLEGRVNRLEAGDDGQPAPGRAAREA